MDILNFRSGTVTQPTDRMREATASAVVGGDPTVNELDESSVRRAVEIMGEILESCEVGNR
ncbi:MAG: hypothetical protein LBS75_06260 [Synergistaceae bacterium]|nr:hypothetical protein [Synergistaceae bacterium]